MRGQFSFFGSYGNAAVNTPVSAIVPTTSRQSCDELTAHGSPGASHSAAGRSVSDAEASFGTVKSSRPHDATQLDKALALNVQERDDLLRNEKIRMAQDEKNVVRSFKTGLPEFVIENDGSIVHALSEKVILFPGTGGDASTSSEETSGYQPNYRKGESQTVYPIKKMGQLMDMAAWLHQNADRKYLLSFVLGINLGLRANELLKLTTADLFNADGSIRYIDDVNDTNDRIVIKQSKTGKTRTVYLNTACVSALGWFYDGRTVVPNKKTYIFFSREGDHIEVDTLRKVLKDAADACGIVQNIGTHTLRKTWGWWQYTTNTGKVYGDIAQLQRLFGHESPQTTLRYIGVMDEEDKSLYHAMVLDVADRWFTQGEQGSVLSAQASQ